MNQTEHDGCEHPFDLHIFLPGDVQAPSSGGLVLCPVMQCPCQSTWSASGLPAPILPPQREIDRLRLAIQMGEM